LLPRNLSVYVRLPGSHEWHGIFLRNGLFYEDGESLNEWHLVARYRKRFNVEGTSSTRGLQAIYVASGVGADESLAQLLLSRTNAELAVVGSTPTPPPPPAQEPPKPCAIGEALARIEAKEQALLAELAELDKVQAAMARVASLEARIAAARAALKDI
jgi:outer membrane protein TolC